MNRLINIWLIAGLLMIFVQVILGGITRLTGSGLSITKWEIVTGVVPPLNQVQWEVEFEKYKETPQYQKINRGMSLVEFKKIYFWEYWHRVWARIMGLVFIIPYLFFERRKAIGSSLRRKLGLLITMASITALFGWIMVASGLNERPWVSGYKLSVHLLLAFAVYGYLLSLIADRYRIFRLEGGTNIRWIQVFMILILVQVILGGLMSGMKTSLLYPTWPRIGEEFFPEYLFESSNWNWRNFVDYDQNVFVIGLVHVLHRMLAYLLLVYVIILNCNAWLTRKNRTVKICYLLLFFGVVAQSLIGICTLWLSKGKIPIVPGVLHQGLALLIFTWVVVLWRYGRSSMILSRV